MRVKIIAVDWGKDSRKRSAYISDVHARWISRLPFDGRLSHLIEHAISLQGPVLIGIDAAIGYPTADWKALARRSGTRASRFTDFLLGDTLPCDFFNPVREPADWSPERPFISPPRGRWSLKAFETASRGGFYRQVDRRLQAQPIFVTSGIPGSVGSGTRALWQELRELDERFCFNIWPFHGPVEKLLRNEQPVIAEIYPKACYGIALSENLPAPLCPIAKTKPAARQHALEALFEAAWTSREKITIEDIQPATASEDDFDALMSAAALTRLFLEKAPLEEADDIDSRVEGGVLGAASLSVQTGDTASSGKSLAGRVQHATRTVHPLRCPVPGCLHVFARGRSGWDAHIASVKTHPDWHPDVRDAARRKKTFRREFPDWFE
jgi:hypothetical protein